MAAAENPCSSSTHTETTAGLCSQAKRDEFLYNFLCDYLASHDEGRDLIEIIDARRGLHLKDLDRISDIYCDFKETKGKTLSRDLKSRKDNLKNVLKLKITGNWIERFSNGTEDGKEYLKYEIKNQELWQSLTGRYPVLEPPRMLHGNFPNANSQLPTEPSSDEGGSYSHSHVSVATTNSTHGNYGTVAQTTTSPRLNDLPDSDDIFSCFEDLPSSDMVVMEHFDQLLSISENEQPIHLATEGVPMKSYPAHCDIKGGDDFVIHADQSLAAGTYYVSFGIYGMCEAQGSGSQFLLGLGKIPAATQRGRHTITVDVSKERFIGKFVFTYTDVFFDQLFDYVFNPPKKSDHRDKTQHPKHSSSGKSCEAPGNHHRHSQKFKNCPVDIPVLVDLCDAMAKMGDEHFFSALIKLGFIPGILKKGSGYCKDIALTAREHGHNELAEIIGTSSSEQPYDCDVGTLTVGKLFDAVQAERSLMANSGSDSSSDCDSNSCTTGYNADIDSDEKTLEGGEPSARQNVEDNNLHGENGDLHAENDEIHVENGHLPTETNDLHTGNGDLHTGNGVLLAGNGDLHTGHGDLHTGNGDLLAGNGDLHTGNGDLHNRIGFLHGGFGPGYSYRHGDDGCLCAESCVPQDSGSQTENCDLQTETSDLFTENGDHNKKSVSVTLAKMSLERKHRNNYEKEVWKDEVIEKLAEVFKDNVEDFVRVLFFLDEEDKAHKDDSDQLYAPQWKSLKDTLKKEKAFRELAKRLSDETRRVGNDQEGDQNFYFKRLIRSLLKSGVWERYRGIIPRSLQVAVISCAGIAVHHLSTVMTTVDDVVSLVDKTGGRIVMVGLAAVYLTCSAYVNIRRWWRDEISGERCIKNLLDTTFTIGAGVVGGFAGAAIGSFVAGPFGAAIGSLVGGWVSAAGMKCLSDVMTRRMFGLPKEEAVENAYRYLGVEMADSNAEINTAFRKLCLKHHPDKGGNEADFFIVQCNMGIIRQARGEF